MYTKSEREYYNQHRANVCEKLCFTVNQYNYIRRIGNELNRIYTADCNGELSEEKRTIQEATQIAKLTVYLENQGIRENVFFQTDPRGATIYMGSGDINQSNYNNFSCIY